MATPVEPAARALQRIRARHTAGPDGLCVEDGQTWPCATMVDADGDPPDDHVATAINRLRTAITAAEAQKPASVVELRRLVREAIDGPPGPPADPPPGGTGPGKEPDTPGPVR